MTTSKHVLVAILIIGCRGDAPPDTAKTRPPAPATRPASITDADIATADQLVAKYEALAKAVSTASDCTKASELMNAAVRDTGPLRTRAMKLDEMARKDPLVESWANANYAARFKGPITAMTGAKCANDPVYAAALSQLLGS